MQILIFLLLFFASPGRADRLPEWVNQARSLIGEKAAVRDEAMAKLRAHFDSLDKLTNEVDGPYSSYALDVAVALKPPGTMSQLINRIDAVMNCRQCAAGALLLAINALVDESNVRVVGDRYLELWRQKSPINIPASVNVAMLDFFTHQRRGLDINVFVNLLNHPLLEVQQAAVLHFAVTRDNNLKRAVEFSAFHLFPQARAQLMLTYFDWKEMESAGKICGRDKDPVVQSACRGLEFQPRKPSRKPKKRVTV